MMEKKSAAEIAELREQGKLLFQHSDGDAEKRSEGLKLLIQAKNAGDPEATYIVAKLLLQGVLTTKSGNPKQDALRMLRRTANAGYRPARGVLNRICEIRYAKSPASRVTRTTGEGIVDFQGKPIRISRKGVLTPVDVVLETENGKNILTLSVNLFFLSAEEDASQRLLKRAVLDGVRDWAGEYAVFGGQALTVRMDITCEDRLIDSVLVTPVTGSVEAAYRNMTKHLGWSKGVQQVDESLENRRSFASIGRKWSVHAPRIIYMLPENDRFDDYDELRAVAKHEFGHVLGLGDLYASESDGLEGVKVGTYRELDCYYVSDDIYNLVMCDHRGPISNNDIEMVLLAFRDNKMQLFQHYGTKKIKGRISEALGRGN